MNGKTIICIIARLKSRRLPQKALAVLYGETLIMRLIERLRGVKIPIVLCTSNNTQDMPLADIAQSNGLSYIQGDEDDVMSRALDAADICGADTIIRVTGDNPLTDPDLLAYLLQRHKGADNDYTYTKDAPRGTRSEIIKTTALYQLYKGLSGTARNDTEYMTNYLFTLPKRENIQLPLMWVARDQSFTVDTPDDLEYVRQIYDEFQGKPPKLEELIQWGNKHPKIKG